MLELSMPWADPNFVIVIAHAAEVPAMNNSSNTTRVIDRGDTPPTDKRWLHDFLLDDATLFAGIVGEGTGIGPIGGAVMEALDEGSLVRSAGCLAGNEGMDTVLVDNCCTSEDSWAI